MMGSCALKVESCSCSSWTLLYWLVAGKWVSVIGLSVWELLPIHGRRILGGLQFALVIVVFFSMFTKPPESCRAPSGKLSMWFTMTRKWMNIYVICRVLFHGYQATGKLPHAYREEILSKWFIMEIRRKYEMIMCALSHDLFRGWGISTLIVIISFREERKTPFVFSFITYNLSLTISNSTIVFRLDLLCALGFTCYSIIYFHIYVEK